MRLGYKFTQSPANSCVIFPRIERTGTTNFFNQVTVFGPHKPITATGSAALTQRVLKDHYITRREHPRFVSDLHARGFHKWIPVPTTYITFLRQDLCAKFLSWYNFYHILGNPTVQSMDIERAIAREAPAGHYDIIGHELDNPYVRHLAKSDQDHKIDGKIGEKHLRDAIAHLEQQYAFVGLTEKMNEEMPYLWGRIGWPDPTPHMKHPRWHEKLNSSYKGKRVGPYRSISPKSKELLLRKLKWDRELMAYIRRHRRKINLRPIKWLPPATVKANKYT